MKNIFEKMGITYHWKGDYLIPGLEPPEAPRIGYYGTMRYNYLRDHHRGIGSTGSTVCK